MYYYTIHKYVTQMYVSIGTLDIDFLSVYNEFNDLIIYSNIRIHSKQSILKNFVRIIVIFYGESLWKSVLKFVVRFCISPPPRCKVEPTGNQNYESELRILIFLTKNFDFPIQIQIRIRITILIIRIILRMIRKTVTISRKYCILGCQYKYIYSK